MYPSYVLPFQNDTHKKVVVSRLWPQIAEDQLESVTTKANRSKRDCVCVCLCENFLLRIGSAFGLSMLFTHTQWQ